jgi:hypothetical protein
VVLALVRVAVRFGTVVRWALRALETVVRENARSRLGEMALQVLKAREPLVALDTRERLAVHLCERVTQNFICCCAQSHPQIHSTAVSRIL